MFLDRTTESESGSQTSPNQRFRWLHSVSDTTLSLALALAVMTSVQPLLFSMLHAWVSPRGALPLPPDAFAASALASLGAAALAVAAVRVISPRLGNGGAPPPRERKVLSELLADLSHQTKEIRAQVRRDPEIAGLLADIGVATDRAASLMPSSPGTSSASHAVRGMALVLANTLALRRRLTQFLTADGFTVSSTVLEDLVLERTLARTPDVRLVVLEAADERRAAELLAELRRSEPLLPVLMITSQELPEQDVSLLLSGPGAVLPPGFTVPDLEQALERMMP